MAKIIEMVDYTVYEIVLEHPEYGNEHHVFTVNEILDKEEIIELVKTKYNACHVYHTMSIYFQIPFTNNELAKGKTFTLCEGVGA